MPGFIRQLARGRTRRVPGEMNQLEKSYAQHLEMRKLAGEIIHWEFEPYKIRLAKKCFIQLDFFVLTSDYQIEFHETKGFMEDDAAVKLKVVAEQNWWFRFLLVKKRAKKDGGGFSITEIGA